MQPDWIFVGIYSKGDGEQRRDVLLCRMRELWSYTGSGVMLLFVKRI